ncbi:pectate lyase family protein [Ochrovirga pacifica]|uniref:hypothetical protein n=1 Tax=Ochrovirga pacifica TaxID=1042376 RepID=UPI001111A83B|nr:hypothetical protein [Ochrovirga pacifica]
MALFVMLLFLGLTSVNAQTNYQKTGYFTRLYAREHVSDMPREYFILYEADGTTTTLSFFSHRSSGQYSIWQFDPKDFLGKTVTIDVEATLDNQNNEYHYFESGSLVIVPKLWVRTINSFVEASSNVSPPSQYQHPITDTIQMPHDILLAKDTYANKNPTQVVQLSSYVTGNGTAASPYVSTDGTAGLSAAIAALPNGGTIEVPSGQYMVTARNLAIPRFVSIKGTGTTQPNFILTQDRMWFLKGSNTIDNISVDFTQNTRRYTHEVIIVDNSARDVTFKNNTFVGNYTVAQGTYEESGNVVMIRMYSHLENIVFEKNTFLYPLRAIATKGTKKSRWTNFQRK